MSLFIDKLIARKVAEALIAAGMPVTVDYNDGEPPLVQSTDVDKILEEAFAVDECWYLVKPGKDGMYDHMVYFIWGNGNCGWDAITDYSTALEEVLKPVNEWIEKES